MKTNHQLFGHLVSACNRTGMKVLMVEDDQALPTPAIEKGEDPYSWGSSGKVSGEDFVLATDGDLLGSGSNPYRIFSRSLSIKRTEWAKALRDFARYRWTTTQEIVPGLGKRIVSTDMPMSIEEENQSVMALFDRGYVPADWPNPLV